MTVDTPTTVIVTLSLFLGIHIEYMTSLQKRFEKFYNQHLDKVYRFVFFRCGANKELAEDLVSEIFIKVLRNFEKYDESISKTSWLMTIAKNHLINHWRDKKETTSLTIEHQDNVEIEADSYFLKEALQVWQGKQNQRYIAELLLKLDQKDREIVTLHYLTGYNYAEIGEMLGVSEGAAKVAAHRAVKKLRNLL